MARESATRKRSTESRLIFTILGVTVWVAAGFLVGLVAGVVSEEPEVLVTHMTGRDTEIEWATRGPAAAGAVPGPGVDRETGTPSAVETASEPLAPVGAPPKSLLDDPPAPAVPVLAAKGEAAAPLEAAAVKSTPRPAPADGPRFLIQVGAYDSRDSAREVAETLRGKGYAVEVQTSSDDGRFRVRVGPVAARDRAEGLARRLEDDEGLPTWILRVRES